MTQVLTGNLAPAFFMSHGAPTVALEHSATTQMWREAGEVLQGSRGIVVISAHWQARGIEITASAKPDLLYDFYGFPSELYQVQYPVVGAPSIAQEVLSLIQSAGLTGAVSQRGLDHGVWVPLLHLWPNANIPVLQMALSNALSWQQHWQLATVLRELRAQGVAVVGSGSLTHNLQVLTTTSSGTTPASASALAFEAWVREQVITQQWQNLVSASTRGDFLAMHPTPEHYLPLLYFAGVVGEGEAIDVLKALMRMGALSMESYRVRGTQ